MATKSKFQAIRGTRDLLPPETALWNHVEETARSVFGTFGFGEIRPPIFEPTELFARAVGGETDIVAKEMYTFIDRSEKLARHPRIGELGAFIQTVKKLYDAGEIPRDASNQLAIEHAEAKWSAVKNLFLEKEGTKTDLEYISDLLAYIDSMQLGFNLSLRPEATASVCRAYIERGMAQLPQPVKLYYVGPMFRRERPQKGRYRQFYQIGAEVLGGSDAPAIDAEVIEMVMRFFDRLGLAGVELDINSIGHNAPDCRPAYVRKLKIELEKVKDKLGADSQRRIETNPNRV